MQPKVACCIVALLRISCFVRRDLAYMYNICKNILVNIYIYIYIYILYKIIRNKNTQIMLLCNQNGCIWTQLIANQLVASKFWLHLVAFGCIMLKFIVYLKIINIFA